jgi:hypothetical protein
LRAYNASVFQAPAQALADPTRIAVVAILRGRQIVLNREKGNRGFCSQRKMPGGMDAGASR